MRVGLGLSGVPVDDVLMNEALQRIGTMIEDGGTHQVATANVDYLVHATKDAEYRRILCMCDLVVADGMPIVWASRLFGVPLRERVAGADLVPLLVKLSSVKGHRIFLLGATPEVAEAAEREMRILSPGVQIVGRLSPPIRPLGEFDNEPILAAIEAAKPHILLVAFGSPKQEMWISQNRHRLNVPVCVGIGGTLDFIAGTVKRAPLWMQRSGMEWLFRVCVEPQRLLPRYFKDALWMSRYLLRQIVMQHAFRQQREALVTSVDSIGTIDVVNVSGAMSGAGLPLLSKTFRSSMRAGRHIVLNLQNTSHIGADGFWTLARLLRLAAELKCDVLLAGLSDSLDRQLRASHFKGLFKSTISVSDAVRQMSRGRLQVNLELGENWAVCRVGGEFSAGTRKLFEELCDRIRQSSEHFEFDSSGLPDFDPANLESFIEEDEAVYTEAGQVRAAGAA